MAMLPDTMRKSINNLKGFDWLLWLLLLISLTLLSCGSKKKLSEKVKQEINHQNDLLLVNINDIISNTVVNKQLKEIIYEPIDPDIPIMIDSTVVKNARVTIRDVKEDSQIAIRDNSKSQLKDKSVTKSKSKEIKSEKDVKHKNHWWIILVVLLLAFVIYLKITRKRIRSIL